MQEPVLIRSFRAFFPTLVIALCVGLVASGSAVAQDPAADQYAPTAPSGGGDVPTASNEDPTVTSAAGGLPDNDAATKSAGSPTEAAAETHSATRDEAATVTPLSAGNKAQRTVEKLGATARDAVAADSRSGGAPPPTAELLRSGTGDDTSLGMFFWVALGLTLLWAVATGVANFRRRGGAFGERQSA